MRIYIDTSAYGFAESMAKECTVCGKEVPKDLSERTHRCPFCGSVMPRDCNSSLNIKLRGSKNGRVGAHPNQAFSISKS